MILPENDRRRNAELDEDLLDVVLQVLGVETPGRLLTRSTTCCWVRSTANGLYFCKTKSRLIVSSLFRASTVCSVQCLFIFSTEKLLLLLRIEPG